MEMIVYNQSSMNFELLNYFAIKYFPETFVFEEKG